MQHDEVRIKVEKAIMALIKVTHVVRLYAKEHNLIKQSIDNLSASLTNIFSEQDEITIGVIGDEIVFDKDPFYEANNQVQGFAEQLKKMKIEKITIKKEVMRKELEDFCQVLIMKPDLVAKLEKLEDVQKILESKSITHIEIGRLGFHKDKKSEDVDKGKINTKIKKDYKDGIDFFKGISEDVSKGKPLNVKFADQFVGKVMDNLLKSRSLLLLLTLIKSHDESLFVHDVNVAIFTLLQAQALGLRKSFLRDIGIAALLHDVGKLSISRDILVKKGKLTDAEWREITLHPINGAKMLMDTHGTNILAQTIAFEHHILFDSSGYPRKPYGKRVNPITLMVTISDVYDAIRSKRAYHESISPEATYEEMMKLSGKHFHPKLLDNFFKIVGVYPPGAWVELDTKEVGLVHKGSIVNVKRPQVEICYDADGQKQKEPKIVNLLEKDENGKFKRSVAKSLPFTDKYEMPEKYI